MAFVLQYKSSEWLYNNSFEPWKAIRVDQLRFEKVLGRGSFGKVMLTSIVGCEHKVAVKAMKKHVVQSNGDVVATAVEKRMLELGLLWNTDKFETLADILEN